MKFFVLLLAMVVACRSSSTRYYTLVAPPESELAVPANQFQLDVLPVEVPPEVDRAEMVVREGPGEVTPVETRAWIAPLRLEIRHAFSDELSRILGARDISGVTSEGLPTFRIKLVVQRFESVLGKRVVVDALSTVREISATSPPLVCSHHASEPAGAGYDGLARAHQKALVHIAQEVAATVRSAHDGAATCAK